MRRLVLALVLFRFQALGSVVPEMESHCLEFSRALVLVSDLVKEPVQVRVEKVWVPVVVVEQVRVAVQAPNVVRVVRVELGLALERELAQDFPERVPSVFAVYRCICMF